MIFRILGPHASAHTPNPSPGLSFPPQPQYSGGSPPGGLAGTEVSDLTSPGRVCPLFPMLATRGNGLPWRRATRGPDWPPYPGVLQGWEQGRARMGHSRLGPQEKSEGLLKHTQLRHIGF